MSAAKAPECIGIFYPKRGAKKYFGLPVICLFILTALNMLFTVFIKSSGDEELKVFLILQSFLAYTGIPAAAALLDAVCEWTATGKFAGKSPKRLMLLRTAPHMERVIRNAFVFDEIRRAGLCILTAALSAAATGLTGHYSYTAPTLFSEAVFTAFALYLLLSVAAFMVRFIDNITLLLFTVYIWLFGGGCVAMMLADFILGGGEPWGAITLAIILGISAGIITCAAAVKRACGSRYPDNK